MRAYVSVYVLKVISVAFGGFSTYQVQEAVDVLQNLPKDYLLQQFFGVSAPAGPAPTALHFPIGGLSKNHHCHYCYLYRKERYETKWFCRDCAHFLCHNGTEDCFCFSYKICIIHFYITRFYPCTITPSLNVYHQSILHYL